MSEVIREPSIHITKTRLKDILFDSLEHYQDDPHYLNFLVDKIFAQASNYALSHRKLLASTQKHAKTAARLTASTFDDARLFSQLLLQVRKQHFHKGVIPIKESSKDWLLVKEIAQSALGFCEDFAMDRKEGYIKYITLALSKMNKFGLAKFHSLHEAICREQESVLYINQDPTPVATETIMRLYNKVILDKTGNEFDYRKLPEKYRYFIEVKKECIRLKIRPEDYIQAQFAAFDWKAAVPEVSQLVGAKALERLNKYLFANNISVGAKPKAITIDFTKIREDHGED